tara:strand:- start:46 stop:1116 length:1071 start_codon:yes stop_codon:yes gene_type:complete
LDRNLLENNHKKVNDQLINIGCRKSKIKKEIYSIYDIYLKIIRSKLKNYVDEAIKALIVESSNGISEKDKKTLLYLKNDLKNLVNGILPFLTIEQLSIKKEYKISNRIINNREFKGNYNLKEEFYTKKNFATINANNSTNYCDFYYENLIYENYSINMDNYVLDNEYSDNYKHNTKHEGVKPTILLNDFDEDKLSINVHQTKDSKFFIPVEFKDIILWIDTIDSSLNLYLRELSIQINNKLFYKKFFKKLLNNYLLIEVFNNHLLFNNPSPFVLTFDPSLIQYINSDDNFNENKFSKINIININSAELEFININLSMLKNKLMELKSNIYLLIKKENYWCNKSKLNSNSLSTLNKY